MLVQEVILPYMSNKKKARSKLEMRASGHLLAHARWIKRTPAGRCLIYRRILALFSTIIHQET